MKNPPDALEWISKAEQDYEAAETMALNKRILYSAVSK